MHLGKIMLIEQSMKRNLQTTLNGRFFYSLNFHLNDVKDMPWKQELEYTFVTEVSTENDKTGTPQKKRLFECKGNYAVGFMKDSDSENDKQAVTVNETANLSWPFIRADINLLLASVQLPLDLPYYVNQYLQQTVPDNKQSDNGGTKN